MIRRLIILLLIVGCIPTTPTLQSTFEINDSGGNTPKAKIVISRPSIIASLIPFYIYDGDVFIGKLGPKGTLTWLRDEGNLQILIPPPSPSTGVWNYQGVNIYVESNKTYTFIIRWTGEISHPYKTMPVQRTSPLHNPNSSSNRSSNQSDTQGLEMNFLLGAKIIAHDGTYLGKISNQFDSESIFNKFGTYGSEFSSSSIFNKFGNYGGEISIYSPFNKITTTPPSIYINGQAEYYFTVNKLKQPNINPYTLIATYK